MNMFKAGADVTDMAKELITLYRPDLIDCNIAYIFREKAPKKGSKLVLAMARKVTEREQLVHDSKVIFIIEISQDTWGTLSASQKRAVLHHEIEHLGFAKQKDGSLVPTLIPHDVEEFSKVIESHGLYTKDVTDFASKLVIAAQAEQAVGLKAEEVL